MLKLSHVLTILLALSVGVLVNLASYGYFMSEELAKAEGRLSLYQSTVSAALERHSYLTHVLARDAYVAETAAGADTGALNERLAGFAAAAGVESIYLMDADGTTIAASNYGQPNSYVGQNYGFRPYFKQAMTGRHGSLYAIGATTGTPGYFIADGVADPDLSGGTLGVIAMKIQLAGLEESWRKAREQVLLTNEDGIVLLSSEPDWRYQTLWPLSAEKRAEIGTARLFPGENLGLLPWTSIAENMAMIGGEERLHLVTNDLPNNWQLHYFTSATPLRTRSWLVTAVIAGFAGVLLFVLQLQRTRRIRDALHRSEKEEAQLRYANEKLAFEITERRSAQLRLQQTQAELQRTSRLAALGQLSASVTHELGQPIAAMRNHLAAAELTRGTKDSVLNSLSGLVDRMEGITRELKFFARRDTQEFEKVDLCAAVQTAVDLLQPNILAGEVAVQIKPTRTALHVRGSKLRIEQVLTNLIRNALDAVEETREPMVAITLGQTGDRSWVRVQDNGHGLGQATLDELQEPFVTSRESGRGMGLGLAISASIMRDHDGQMEAHNLGQGGAVFKVCFPSLMTATSPDIPTSKAEQRS